MSRDLTLICLSAILAVCLVGEWGFTAVVALRLPALDSIRLRKGSPSFKIALFADLHFGENSWTEWGPKQDVNSLRVMSSVLDQEQPDFVVYLGDVITANNIMAGNASLYWDQAISPVRQRSIPFCSVFGNHDDASFQWPFDWFSQNGGVPPVSCVLSSGYGECTTRVELMRNEIVKNEFSFSQVGPRDLWPAVSNYLLNILSGDSQLPLAYFYFFDSGGGSYPEVISAAQVNWFQHRSMNLNPNKRLKQMIEHSNTSVPEIIFWHIPTEAYKDIAPSSNGNKKCVGSIFAEQVASQEAEMGIMEVLEQRSSVKAIFVGHNHGLDWCCPWKKLWLCFARHTGYGGYGNWERGSRVIEIKQTPFSLKTWITMENGTSHSEVILSS